MINRPRSLVVLTLLSALVLSGCQDGGESPDVERSDEPTRSEASYPWVTEPEESFDEAVDRIESTLASEDCGEIAALTWGGQGDMNDKSVKQQCETLKTRLGSDGVTDEQELGEAGGVLQFSPKGRGRDTRVAAVVDSDGRYHLAFFDYPPLNAKELDDGRHGPFLSAAEDAAAAIGEGDCDGLAKVAHHSRPRSWVCGIADSSLSGALERRERGLRSMGASSDYALFGIRGINVYWVLVMARQSPKSASAAKAYKRGNAPEYALANVVRVDSGE